MTLEHELILAHILDVDRAYFITHQNPELSDEQKKLFDHMKVQLESGTPLPYILGYKEFYGRRFMINQHTLIPRPETELFIDIIKTIVRDNTTIIDVGTGSGCIAITAALETQASVHATDISDEALDMAKQNAHEQKAPVIFHQGNLLENIQSTIKNAIHLIICANLPYIPTKEYFGLPPDVRAEPRHALDGGEDGMKYYKELFTQARSYILPNTHILCEIMPDQTEYMRQYAQKIMHADALFHNDLTNRPRIAHIKTP